MLVTGGVKGAAGASGVTFGLTGTPETIGPGNESDGFNVSSNFYVKRAGNMQERYENYGSFTGPSTFGGYSNGDYSDTTFGDSYHVRVTHQTGFNDYSSGAGLASWIALTSDRQWNFVESRSGPDSSTTTYLVEFSDDGGSTVLDSFTLTISKSWDSP